MKRTEKIIIAVLIMAVLIALGMMCQGASAAEPVCELIANIQPDETEQRVEYTDPQGRELCRLKIYLHDRTVIGFAPPGGEHGGYTASFNGAHVQGHRTDPNVDLISHAQVFAVANIPPTEITPTEPSGVTPTATLTVIPPTPTDTALPPTATATLPPGVTPSATPTITLTATHLPPTLIPPVEITPTPSDTPTVDIYYPPPQEGKSPPAPRLPTTGMDGSNGDFWVILFATVFIGFLIILMWRGRRNR